MIDSDDLEELQEINAAIERLKAFGSATPHLQRRKRHLEARISGTEHAAADSLPETMVPRRPGRPRKLLSDADRPISS